MAAEPGTDPSNSSAVTPFGARRFLALDGWRGICALFVAALHFSTTGHISAAPLVANAYLFVDFFFVLSGFIVSHAYFERLNSAHDIRLMVWRRIARLWPLHLAILLLFILLELAVPVIATLTGAVRSAAGTFDPNSSALVSAIPSNILMLHGLGLHDRLTWNLPSWSISVELWTYLVFGIAVWLTRRHTLLLAVLLICLGIGVVAGYSQSYMSTEYDYGFFRCLYGFFAGHLVLRLFRAVPGRLSHPSCSELGATIAVLAFVIVCASTPFELAAPVIMAIAVWVFAHEQGAVSRILKWRSFQLLGLWSYAIYMTHAFVITIVHRGLSVLEQKTGGEFIGDRSSDLGFDRVISFGSAYAMDFVMLAYLACVIGLSALAWRWIEMPAQRFMNSKIASDAAKSSLVTGYPVGQAREVAQGPAN